jgi:thioredoxin reductase (NADPH)
MLEQEKPIVIIGGGVAGAAAALRAAQYDIKVLWFLGSPKSVKRSRMQWVKNIDNMIGVHPWITQKLIGRKFAKELPKETIEQIETVKLDISTREIVQNVKDRLEAHHKQYVTLFSENVTDIIKIEDGFKVSSESKTFEADYIILATGVMDQQPLLPLQDKTTGELHDSIKPILNYANHEDILYCIRCEGHLTKQHATAIIGSTESAAYVACMLHERYGNQLCILTHGEKPGWKNELNELLFAYNIKVYTHKITQIIGKPGALEGFKLADEKIVNVRYAFCMLGLHKVYNELAKGLGVKLEDKNIPDEQKHVLIDQKGETSIANFFAIGDMTRHPDASVMKQVYTSQEYAVRAVDTIDGRLRLAYRQKRFGNI